MFWRVCQRMLHYWLVAAEMFGRCRNHTRKCPMFETKRWNRENVTLQL